MLILDEPTSALDVSLQAQIIKLLRNLRDGGLTHVLISHYIAVVRRVSTRIVVMSKGRVVEEGATEDIMRNPRSVYTRKLIEDLLYFYEYLEK